jgi:hypothetical protein
MDRTVHPPGIRTANHKETTMSYLSRQRVTGPSITAPLGTFLTDDQIRQYAPSAFAEQAHESRSERFSPIPTSHVIIGMRREGFEVVTAGQSRTRDASRKEFTKHLLRMRRVDAKADAKVGDVFPEVVLVNANDGSSRYVLSAGLYRLICLNGMTVSERQAASVRVSHMGDVVGKVIEGSFTVLDDSQRAIEHAREWSAIDLTPVETTAFAEAARVLRFGNAEGTVTTPITADQLLEPHRRADMGNTLWQTFNRVQENVIRGGLVNYDRSVAGRPRRVSTRPINGIDQDQRLNRALWTLAETLAERKAA